MANLLNRVFGLNNNCVDQRPSRDDFQGINGESSQAQYLAAWWPVWEPMANAQKAPQAMDYGPYAMHMTPSANTLHVGDAQMGTCWFGKANPTGISGVFSGQAQARPYSWGQVLVDPVDFGALPNTTAFATPYMSTAWIKMPYPATDFVAGDTPWDTYIYSFDRNDGVDFPGHTLGVIRQIANTGSDTNTVTAACATMYDNNVGNDPFGVQSLQIVNDGYWHLICGIYLPPTVSAALSGVQYILVDGQVGFIGGKDSSPNNQPFGMSNNQTNMGSPQDATHVAANPVYQVIGADDDGVGSPFLGWIGDHRLYNYSTLRSTASCLDILSVAFSQAAAMYAPETRWELYRKNPQGSSSFPGPAASAQPWTWIPTMGPILAQ